ncbi:MAG: thioredoxin family protein [Candidatus Polarisedimenticolia bacterium]
MRRLRGLAVLAAAAALGAFWACSSQAEPPVPSSPPAKQDPPAAQAAPQSPQPGQTTAAEPAQDPNLWFPRYDWALEVDGKPSDEALFFVDIGSRKVLVHVVDLPQSALMDLGGKQVASVENRQIAIDPENGTARIATGVEPGGATPFTVEGGQVVFYLGSRRFKITPKQPLEGPASAEDIFRHTPLYRRGKQDYVPAAADIAQIRSYDQTVEIVVYFGTWCPHCKVLVPRFMKAVEAAGNPRIEVKYVGVPRAFGQYEPTRSRGVTGVPCFIFYRDGREFGRIPGEPAGMTIEHAVAEILKSAGA